MDAITLELTEEEVKIIIDELHNSARARLFLRPRNEAGDKYIAKCAQISEKLLLKLLGV